jgi:hypothetical protein
MISSPTEEGSWRGAKSWHALAHWAMFRDLGDGRCRVYVCAIAQLFERLPSGRHVVMWDTIETLALERIDIDSHAALAADPEPDSGAGRRLKARSKGRRRRSGRRGRG